MPKNGMLVRISLALAAVAVLATIAVSAAGAARQSTDSQGRGQHLRPAAHQRLDSASEPRRQPVHVGEAHQRDLRRRRLGCRCRGHHDQDGRLRCERRTAQRVRHDVHDVRSDPVGALGHGDDLPHRRRHEDAQHERPGAREDLPRPDHVLGRQGDQGAQQGREHPAHGRSRPCTATRRRARRTTSPTTSRASRRRSGRRMYGATTLIRTWPGSNAVQAHGSSGVAAAVDGHERRDRLRRRLVRHHGAPQVHVHPEQARPASSSPTLASIATGVQARHHAEGRRVALDRQPAEHHQVLRGVPDLDVHVRRCPEAFGFDGCSAARRSSPGRSRPARATRPRTIFVPLPTGVVKCDKTQINEDRLVR